MISKLDRYVLRRFLAWFVMLTLAVLGVLTALDVIGHADEIALTAETFSNPWRQTITYYLWALIPLTLQMLPYLLLIAGVATVVTMLRSREWTPMTAAGISSQRVLRPLLLASFAITVGAAMAREAVLPAALANRELQERRLMKQEVEPTYTDVWLRTAAGDRMRAARFYPVSARIVGFEVHARTINGDRFIEGSAATWDGERWQLRGGLETRPDGVQQAVESYRHPEFGPEFLTLAWLGLQHPTELSAGMVKELRSRDLENRVLASTTQLLAASLFVPLVLLALVLPSVLHFGRRSSLDGIARGLLLCMAYFLVEFACRDMGGRGVLPPLTAGWFSLLLFGGIGLHRFDRLAT